MRQHIFHHAAAGQRRGVFVIGVAVIAGLAIWASTGPGAMSSKASNPRAVSVADAREMIRSRTRGYGEASRSLASRLWNSDRYEEALGLLDEVEQHPETAEELALSLRQHGEYHLRLGNRPKARACFEEHIRCVQGNPSLVRQCGLSYYNAISQLASLNVWEGDTAGAAALIDRLIAENEAHAFLDQSQALTVYRQRSQIAERVGDRASAVASLQKARETLPHAWQRDRLTCERELLRLTDPSQSSDQSLAGLRSLWNDPDLQLDPNIFYAGLQLIQGLSDRGFHPEACDIAFEAVMKLHSSAQAWADPHLHAGSAPFTLESQRREELGLLAFLQSAETHARPDHARFAAQRLVDLLPAGNRQDTARADLARRGPGEPSAR